MIALALFFYEPDYFLKNPLEILKIWKGGLASHGWAIGILLALSLSLRMKWLSPNMGNRLFFQKLFQVSGDITGAIVR